MERGGGLWLRVALVCSELKVRDGRNCLPLHIDKLGLVKVGQPKRMTFPTLQSMIKSYLEHFLS